MTAELIDICRYPVKGLSAEKLETVSLTSGEGLPHDRRFALARGDIAFDPTTPSWLRKTNFYMLMRNESLARLQSRFDDQSGTLTIQQDGKALIQADITTPLGRNDMEQFFATFLGDEAKDGHPRILEAPGHMFGDASRKEGAASDKYVSIIGMESIRALEQQTGSAVDPIRFRANLYVEGTAAWEEFTWVGKTLSVGGAKLRVLSPTVRCAATQVNPVTAERDLNVPKALQKAFGHVNMGVYAEVITGGRLSLGDRITLPN
jgi:uncharacterized protein YcbX